MRVLCCASYCHLFLNIIIGVLFFQFPRSNDRLHHGPILVVLSIALSFIHNSVATDCGITVCCCRCVVMFFPRFPCVGR